MGSLPRKLVMSIAFPGLFIAGWWSAKSVSATKKEFEIKQDRLISKMKNQSTINMEKHLMPVTLSIEPMSEIPEGPDELVTVKGQIKTPFDDFDRIHFEWKMEEGIELVKGQLTGTIDNPVAGHVYELELVLKNFDKQNRRELNLQGYVLDPQGIRLGNSTNITSRPEDSLEHIAPVMMVKAQELREKMEGADRVPASDR